MAHLPEKSASSRRKYPAYPEIYWKTQEPPARADVRQCRDLRGLGTFGYLYSSAQRVVQKAIREIYSIMELSMEVLKIADAHSREISRQVGEVVVALQFHDIARQKIEHVVMAIRDAERICRGEREGSSPDSALARAHKILFLQTAQLKEVIREIQGAYEKSLLAFRGLDRHVEQLVSDISVFETRQRTESRIEERIHALKAGLEQLGDLLSQGRGLEKQIKDTAEQVTHTASQLSGHIDQVRGISMELHLKALNAVVKSARLAESGQVLEILAQEVSRLSRQSDKFVSNVVEILQSLVSLSLELDLDSLETPESSDSTLSLSVEDGIRELAENYEQFKMNTSAATAGAMELRTAVGNTGTSLDFLPELAEEIGDYLEQLEAMTEKLEPWNIHAKEIASDKLDHIARRYTMKSERRLHRQYVGDISDPEKQRHDKEAADSFRDRPGNHGRPDIWKEADDSGKKDRKENTDTCAVHSEAAADEEPGTAEKQKKGDEEEDLGDNVELF
ncbi:MAG: methyl-accepting chemotaxis protein [Desulfobacterales bacterium]